LGIIARLKRTNHARVNESHIQALENVLVYHRHVREIVLGVCDVLLQLCRISSPATIASHSSTMAATLRSVFALHTGAAFTAYSQFLDSVEMQVRALRATQRQRAAGERNYWLTLSTNAGDAHIVEATLARMSSAGRGLIQQKNHANTLSLVLSLHLQSEPIVASAFTIVSRLATLEQLTPSLTQALLQASRLHPEVGKRFQDLVDVIASRDRKFSAFDRSFGKMVDDEVVFTCSALSPKPWGPVSLVLTKNHVCLGDAAFALADVERIDVYRSYLRPALRFILQDRSPQEAYECVVFRRDTVLAHIKKLGFDHLVKV